MELISPKDVDKEVLIAFLETLGYKVEGGSIYDDHGEEVIDPFIDEPVTLENVFIAKGSTIILDNNPISLAGYFQEYGDPLEA